MIIGWQKVKGYARVDRTRRKILFFEGRGVYSVDTFSALSFPFSSPSRFILPLLVPSGREERAATINERIKLLSSYYSLRPCLSILSKAHDKREDKLVGKSSRCPPIRRPDSPKDGPRGENIRCRFCDRGAGWGWGDAAEGHRMEARQRV